MIALAMGFVCVSVVVYILRIMAKAIDKVQGEIDDK